MNKKLFQAILSTGALLFVACGTSPIRATQISNQDQKNIWIEEADSGLFYCVPSVNGAKEIDPVCFPARRRHPKDSIAVPAALVDAATEFKESKESKEPKESKDLKEPREPKELKEMKKSASEPISEK
jgi:hypothetical protein